MKNNNIKNLLLLALLTSPFSVDASNLATLDGPSFCFDRTQKFQRIYHAFDLPYCQEIDRKKTFDDEDMTPIIKRLGGIKARGYTHVQISPPQLSKPSHSTLSHSTANEGDIWYLAYQPYVCVLGNAYKQELSAVLEKPGADLRSQYGITLSDGSVIGYHVGNGRYGSLTDLKTLIEAAKKVGLGIIADAVLNHAAFDHGGPSKEVKDMVISDFHPIAYNASANTFALSGLNFPDDFFHANPGPEFKLGQDTWDWGPDLNTGNPIVQKMIVGYLKLLHNLGITGFRFDAMRHIASDEFQTILKTLKTEIKDFSMCGYGEVWDTNYSSLDPYLALAPLGDFVMMGTITDSFALGQSMKTLVIPNAMGNVPTVTFSVTHDTYPGVATGEISKFYPIDDPKDADELHTSRQNPQNILNSQLAISYLLARRDGSPIILRFEDEKDTSGLISRSLHFRARMDEKNAPHEYTKALSDDVLLIGRQYGFAVINKGTANYTVTPTDLRDNAHLPFYIPNGNYKDSSETPYIIPGLTLTVPARNAAFLYLQDSTDQKSFKVGFQYKVKKPSEQRYFVVGNHPLLGNWQARPDGFNMLLNKQSYEAQGLINPLQSLPIRFPAGLSLQYTVLAETTIEETTTTQAANAETSIPTKVTT
ncbi:alpha-amylase family glycosyl hydrolase [Candidatus Finniella inopinata]|uniref:alpha-amylase family glycosyl hydrolase n=1 Tax=Candidatus Finniella inopinata TaxID=1696036 RepID=UPI0013EEB446|nr:alpha-amylase family glycosyl hydrolase [Candidatus Finniella inopinata]